LEKIPNPRLVEVEEREEVEYRAPEIPECLLPVP